MSQNPEIATASAGDGGRATCRPRDSRAQKRLPNEIIVVDDASTDNSLKAINQLAAGSNIIHVLANPTNKRALAALSHNLWRGPTTVLTRDRVRSNRSSAGACQCAGVSRRIVVP